MYDIAVSFADCHDNVSLKEARDACIFVLLRSHVALDGHYGVRLTTPAFSCEAANAMTEYSGRPRNNMLRIIRLSAVVRAYPSLLQRDSEADDRTEKQCK
jgi:hypothetical protein